MTGTPWWTPLNHAVLHPNKIQGRKRGCVLSRLFGAVLVVIEHREVEKVHIANASPFIGGHKTSGSLRVIECVDASTHTKNHLLGGGVAEHGWVSERRDTFRSQSSVRKKKFEKGEYKSRVYTHLKNEVIAFTSHEGN